jgi:hypothetical protein
MLETYPPKTKSPGLHPRLSIFFVLRLIYTRPTRWTESAGTLVPIQQHAHSQPHVCRTMGEIVSGKRQSGKLLGSGVPGAGFRGSAGRGLQAQPTADNALEFSQAAANSDG